MTEESIITDDILSSVQSVLEEMNAGNERNAVKALDDLVKAREVSIFQELGKLTREFHDALSSFRLDSRIASLAEDDIPDARERLHHVITMTNDAAELTLNAVEKSVPLCDSILADVNELDNSWKKFQRKDMEFEEFRKLSANLSSHFDSAKNDVEAIRSNLNSVLMAQGFQDLTGQIIQRVIKMVEEVESNLVNLIRLSSQKVHIENDHVDSGKSKEEADMRLEGPQVPGMESSSAVSGQDEVDDLLSSLGF